MQLFGDSFKAGDLYKRFRVGKKKKKFCDNGYHWVLQWGGFGEALPRIRFSVIAGWTRHMKRVDHDSQAWSRPKFARFKRSRKCLRWEGYY